MWFTIGCDPELAVLKNGVFVNAGNYFKLNFLTKQGKLQARLVYPNQKNYCNIPSGKKQYFKQDQGNPLIK
ncbi:MAG: hypothetical protein V1773_01785 [bacterium]